MGMQLYQSPHISPSMPGDPPPSGKPMTGALLILKISHKKSYYLVKILTTKILDIKFTYLEFNLCFSLVRILDTIGSVLEGFTLVEEQSQNIKISPIVPTGACIYIYNKFSHIKLIHTVFLGRS